MVVCLWRFFFLEVTLEVQQVMGIWFKFQRWLVGDTTHLYGKTLISSDVKQLHKHFCQSGLIFRGFVLIAKKKKIRKKNKYEFTSFDSDIKCLWITPQKTGFAINSWNASNDIFLQYDKRSGDRHKDGDKLLWELKISSMLHFDECFFFSLVSMEIERRYNSCLKK